MNPTGNPDQGGDWVLESDGVDARVVYFDEERIEEFEGVLLPPVLTGGSTHYYTEGDGTLIIDPTVQVADPDSANLVSARVTISSGYEDTEDVLDYGGTTFSSIWDPGVGRLMLMGSAPVSAYQSALRTVTYENINTFDPTATAKSIEMVVNDGVDDSTFGAVSDIIVIPVNDPPVITVSGTLEYTAGGGAVVLESGISVSDVDSEEIMAATVAIANYIVGEDHLDFPGYPNIVGTFDTAAGIMTLQVTSSITVDNFEAALASITYENPSTNPSTAQRTVTWTVNDGMDDSAAETTTIYFTRAPEVTAGNLMSYTEEDGQILIDPGIFWRMLTAPCSREQPLLWLKGTVLERMY